MPALQPDRNKVMDATIQRAEQRFEAEVDVMRRT
jgi:hypothetical protein